MPFLLLVLLPPTQNVVDIARANDFTILIQALEAASLTDVFEGDGPYTVFAPTDAAFNKLGEATITALLDDIRTLANILLYHVTTGYVGSRELVGGDPIETLAEGGAEINVRPNGKVLNENSRFEVTDVIGTNGVVHVIDTVLIPPAMSDPE